ncbi:MAG: hypothetical protein Q8N45_12490, partial [Anaerolineales bacterium]|nr:hypothetical protein [Anaerolineales bacterium]
MKKTEKLIGEMFPVYDFTGKKGERGKYYKAYRQGHIVKKGDAHLGAPLFCFERQLVLQRNVREKD